MATQEHSISTSPSEDLSHLTGKHIIIAGAGISGLAFPVALARLWPSYIPQTSQPKISIYERDSEHDRLGREGYSLSIRVDGDRGGGVQVLDDLNLYNNACDAAVLVENDDADGSGPAFCLWEPGSEGWNEILRLDNRNFQNNSKRKLSGMRIRRNALQKVLVDAVSELPNVEIKWETSIVTAVRNENNATSSMNITLSNDTKTTCDILLDASGSRSKIRSSIRPDLNPPSGLNFAETIILSGIAKFASAAEIPTPLQNAFGMCLAWNGIGSFLSPVDKTSTLWSLSYKSTSQVSPLKHPLSQHDVDMQLQRARELGQHLGPHLNPLIDATDPRSLLRINCLDRPPFTHDLSAHANVIFLGDANHAVSPFAGNGANMALIDAWELANAMVECKGLDVAVKQFEREMVPRCRAVLQDSRRSIAVAHAEGVWGWVYWALARVLRLYLRLSLHVR